MRNTELPAAENAEGDAVTIDSPSGRVSSESSEVQKLRVERDTLIDRLVRLESKTPASALPASGGDFREYALADAVKALLPILDSFERALQTGSAERSVPAAELISSTSNCRMRYRNWDCALSRQEANSLTLTFTRRSRWWIQPRLQIIKYWKSCSAATKLKDRLLRPSMVRVARNPKH